MESSLLGSEAAAKVITKDSMCPTLTVKQRIYGFVTCFCLGILFSLLSMGGIFAAFLSPTKFAILYSLGNITSMGSTLFLFGPASQCKRMFKRGRIIATSLYLLALISTLVFCLFIFDSKNRPPWQRLVVLLLILLQFCTLFWYTLSYIPFGRALFKKICFACCCSDEEEEKVTPSAS